MRLDLVRKWAENPDGRDTIEAAYRELRLLLAQNAVIDKYELQRRLIGNSYLDLRHGEERVLCGCHRYEAHE